MGRRSCYRYSVAQRVPIVGFSPFQRESNEIKKKQTHAQIILENRKWICCFLFVGVGDGR